MAFELDEMDRSIEERMADRLLFKEGIETTPFLKETLVSLFRAAREGHLCIPFEGSLPSRLCTREEGLTRPFPPTPLVSEGKRLYFQRNWALETLLIQKIMALLGRPLFENCDPVRFEEGMGTVPLEEAQRVAMKQAFGRSLSIFTGGPGTGKTYTASHWIRLLASSFKSSEPFKVVVAAPTGKAAAHLAETLQRFGPLEKLSIESTTLHHLLRLKPWQQKILSTQTLDAHLVVVDEASMLDASLMLHLFNAIGNQTRLLLIGDANQLPPIETGSLFPELASLLGCKLQVSKRTSEGGLFEMGQRLQRGEMGGYPLTPWGEWLVHPNRWIEALAQRLPSPIYDVEPDPNRCLEEQTRFRVLSALRQGPFGTERLNQEVSHYFEMKALRGQWLAIPILITQNDVRQQIYNGTMGVLIRKVGSSHSVAYLQLPGGVQGLPEEALPSYEIAFCLSVHKSQGSEFKEVLALFPPGSERFGREALYTAVTRAKAKVELMIEEDTLNKALASTARRQSGFSERYTYS